MDTIQLIHQFLFTFLLYSYSRVYAHVRAKTLAYLILDLSPNLIQTYLSEWLTVHSNHRTVLWLINHAHTYATHIHTNGLTLEPISSCNIRVVTYFVIHRSLLWVPQLQTEKRNSIVQSIQWPELLTNYFRQSEAREQERRTFLAATFIIGLVACRNPSVQPMIALCLA